MSYPLNSKRKEEENISALQNPFDLTVSFCSSSSLGQDVFAPGGLNENFEIQACPLVYLNDSNYILPSHPFSDGVISRQKDRPWLFENEDGVIKEENESELEKSIVLLKQKSPSPIRTPKHKLKTLSVCSLVISREFTSACGDVQLPETLEIDQRPKNAIESLERCIRSSNNSVKTKKKMTFAREDSKIASRAFDLPHKVLSKTDDCMVELSGMCITEMKKKVKATEINHRKNEKKMFKLQLSDKKKLHKDVEIIKSRFSLDAKNMFHFQKMDLSNMASIPLFIQPQGSPHPGFCFFNIEKDTNISNAIFGLQDASSFFPPQIEEMTESINISLSAYISPSQSPRKKFSRLKTPPDTHYANSPEKENPLTKSPLIESIFPTKISSDNISISQIQFSSAFSNIKRISIILDNKNLVRTLKNLGELIFLSHKNLKDNSFCKKTQISPFAVIRRYKKIEHTICSIFSYSQLKKVKRVSFYNKLISAISKNSRYLENIYSISTKSSLEIKKNFNSLIKSKGKKALKTKLEKIDLKKIIFKNNVEKKKFVIFILKAIMKRNKNKFIFQKNFNFELCKKQFSIESKSIFSYDPKKNVELQEIISKRRRLKEQKNFLEEQTQEQIDKKDDFAKLASTYQNERALIEEENKSTLSNIRELEKLHKETLQVIQELDLKLKQQSENFSKADHCLKTMATWAESQNFASNYPTSISDFRD